MVERFVFSGSRSPIRKVRKQGNKAKQWIAERRQMGFIHLLIYTTIIGYRRLEVPLPRPGFLLSALSVTMRIGVGFKGLYLYY